MSILIKGIDMPSRIDLDFHDNHIVLGGVLYPIDIDQLVYIPTPHGRLIDGDELCNEFSNRCPGDCGCCGESRGIYDCGLIIKAPTILEAEE